MREDLLDPDRAAAAGAALGQLACALPDGGLLLSASRLVEFNVRAPILLAPGLFRLDLTPQEETLGVLTRPLSGHPVHWRADQSTWDGYRDAGGVQPLELHALFALPDGPLAGVAARHLLHRPRRGRGPLRRQGRAARAGVVSARADALLRWYRRVRRPLPWRATRDPYALLVSEVMLQQTQAARVVPYYEAFLARFPDPAALAAAPARDVLAAWSGLGYNRRALALQAAARAVAAGGWPDDLTALPGVGPYTAAAVASFAWDEQRAAVDVNVRRVIERWDGARHAPRALASRAGALLPAGRAGGVEPGDDGARRDRVHRARGRLRGLPGRRVVRERRRAARARRRPGRRGRGSRRPTATSAAASSPRCSRARRCPTSSRSGSSARSPGWPATA